MLETTLTLPSDTELILIRAFHAPAQPLFDVWTKPEHIRQWYGVRGTTVTVCDIDLRVGGAWRWVVVRPGLEIAFSGVFLEIDAPHRLQRTERFEAVPGPGAIATLTFAEADGWTTLTSHMLFETRRDRDMCLKSGMEDGVKEAYANIDAMLVAPIAR